MSRAWNNNKTAKGPEGFNKHEDTDRAVSRIESRGLKLNDSNKARDTFENAMPDVAVAFASSARRLMLIASAEGVDMSVEFLAVLVVLNIIATIALWVRAARRPPRPKKKFLRTLMHSKPITPKHEPPKVAGGQFKSVADDDDRRFFSDFAEFADVANWWLADDTVGTHWRLQELPDGDLSLNVDSSYGPTLGRCYDIFHNQVRLGRLEIQPGDEYSAATPTPAVVSSVLRPQ